MRGTDSGYVYLIEPGFAGAGRTVWRWSITRMSDGAMVCTGVSLAEESAQKDVLAVIRSRASAEPAGKSA